MKTAAEIYNQMDDEIPFVMIDEIKPYIIEAMETYANQSKWISVSDGLPKIGEYVIAYNGDEQMVCKYTTYQKGSIGYAKGLKECWFEYISNRNSAIRFINVTHWQPSPQKP